MESNSEIKEQLESSGVDQQDLPLEEFSTLKDEVSMLKDKIAHLQSQLEESENEAIMAAEIGQQLLEQKSSLEALREQERNNFTTKLEELTQENFNITAKLESRERLLESQSHDDNWKAKQEQEKELLIASHERKMIDLKNDLKKEKMRHDEETSQLNLIIQQNKEVIENLHCKLVEEKAKDKAVNSKLSNDEEIEELKMVLEVCHQAKRQAETKLCEMIHDNERKCLESENLMERLKDVNEELKDKSKQIEDCYQHLEVAKNTINELNLEISSQQMELKSRGHSRKGNSLFGELEDKRVAAERDLAIFKLRYESLRKAYSNAKHEMIQMRYQVLGFLQTRAGDRADRLRIEQLERALSAKRSEATMLSAKLKQIEQYKKSENPVNELKEQMESFQGSEALTHYVNLLLVNAEESKHKIEILQKELESVRFRLIAKDDQLQETERKLYTATNSSEKHRNESLKVKLKVDEMKSKYDTEVEKRAELEGLLAELGILDRTCIPAKDFNETMKDKKLLLPKYLQTEVANDDGESKKSSNEEKDKNEELNSWLDAGSKRPLQVLTEKERREKCCRLLRNTLPKELADEYIKKYQEEKDKDEPFNECKPTWKKKKRTEEDSKKSRKVSFKDEVDVHEINPDDTSLGSKDFDENFDATADDSQVTRNSLREDKLLRSKAVVVNGADALIDPIEDEACKVQ